jgi:hypothetical protein
MICDLTGICIDPHDLQTIAIQVGGIFAFMAAVGAIALGFNPGRRL